MECVPEDVLFADAEDEVLEAVNVEDLDDEDFYSEDEDDENTLEDIYYYNEFSNKVSRLGAQPNANGGVQNGVFQPTSNFVQRFGNRINTGNFRFDNHVSNTISETEKKLDKTRNRIKDKADRATVEQVMDPRTRVILAKMINKGTFDELNGCISTGKEANVYHGVRGDQEVAVKIFKTAIMVFKNRDKYVSGEFRFSQGLCKNPRKMIRTWSEKEMRNLNRMHAQGLNVPYVYEWRSHVIVMDFIGKKTWAAPKLKDVELTDDRWRRVYRDVVVIMWKLHNKCKLVHADLSEFNMLYYKGEVYLIDVSQSIESTQKSSFYFLRKDMKNVTSFFRRKSIPAMTIKDLFKFIVDANTNESNMEQCLDALSEKYSSRPDCRLTPEEEFEDNVIMEISIVKSLSEINDVEKEIASARAGVKTDGEYRRIVGLTQELEVANEPEILQEVREAKRLENPDLDGESLEGGSEDSDSEENETKFVNSARPKHETVEEKKLRKKAIKEENAEKRKTKIKKHVKKQKIKNTKK